MKKNYFKLAVCLITALVMSAIFAACNDVTNNSDDTASAATYVSLSINPSVELLTDENGIVINVNYVNKDAEALLSETVLIGMTVETATETFVRLATEAGYIDVASIDNEISITVVNDDTEKAEEISNKLSQKAQKYFDDNGIRGLAVKETLEDLQAQATELEISVYKLKLILAAIQANPENTIEELVGFSTEKLRELLKSYFNDIKDIATDIRETYHVERDVIREKYVDMFTLETEIEQIEEELEEFVGSEEEKTALENSLKQKKTEFEALHSAYKDEIEAAREKYKEESKAIKEELKGVIHSRRNAIKAKVEEHINNFKKSFEKFKEEAFQKGIEEINLKIINLLTEMYPEEYTADKLKDLTTEELIDIVKTKYEALKTTTEQYKNDYDAEIKAIEEDTKYAAVHAMLEEIDGLENELKLLKQNKLRLQLQLASEKDISAVQVQIDTKQAEIDAKLTDSVLVEYKAAMKNAYTNYQNKSEVIKGTLIELSNIIRQEDCAFIHEIEEAYKNQRDEIKEATENMFGNFMNEFNGYGRN